MNNSKEDVAKTTPVVLPAQALPTITLYTPDGGELIYEECEIGSVILPDLKFKGTALGGGRVSILTNLGYVIELPE